jgi:glutathione synthase/RimK-type ligase-like ATP-grasp enzyme
LSIKTPETINNVTREQIPLWLHAMGGHAVLKVPYSNAGQGVYTITNENELNDFLAEDHHYDKVIILFFL